MRTADVFVLPVLGRLYVEAGQPLLAERCLAAARSHDPGSPATWEAMGSLAALSPQGEGFFPTPITMVLKKTSQALKVVSAVSRLFCLCLRRVACLHLRALRQKVVSRIYMDPMHSVCVRISGSCLSRCRGAGGHL
jgi:hypothetical protein